MTDSDKSKPEINEADGIYKDLIRAIDFAEWGWSIIANASGGDWTKASKEWQTAAAKYRDDFHNEIRFLAGVPLHQSKTEQLEPKTMEIKEPSELSTVETQKCPDGYRYLERGEKTAKGDIYQVGGVLWRKVMHWGKKYNPDTDWITARGNEAGAALFSKESEVASLQRKLEEAEEELSEELHEPKHIQADVKYWANWGGSEYGHFTGAELTAIIKQNVSQRAVIEQMRKAAQYIYEIAWEKDNGDCAGMLAGSTAIISVQRWASEILTLSSPVEHGQDELHAQARTLLRATGLNIALETACKKARQAIDRLFQNHKSLIPAGVKGDMEDALILISAALSSPVPTEATKL